MQPTNFKKHVRMNDQIPLVLSWQKITGFTKPTLITPKPKKLLNNGKLDDVVNYIQH